MFSLPLQRNLKDFFSFHNPFPGLSFSSRSCLLLPLYPFLFECQEKATYPTVLFAGSQTRCNSCPQVPHLPPLASVALSPGSSSRQARPYQISYARIQYHRKPRPQGKRVSLFVFHSPFSLGKLSNALVGFGGPRDTLGQRLSAAFWEGDFPSKPVRARTLAQPAALPSPKGRRGRREHHPPPWRNLSQSVRRRSIPGKAAWECSADTG